MPQPLLNITPPRSPGKKIYKSKVERVDDSDSSTSSKSTVDVNLQLFAGPDHVIIANNDHQQHAQAIQTPERYLENNWRRTSSFGNNSNFVDKGFSITPPHSIQTNEIKELVSNTTVQPAPNEVRLSITQHMLEHNHSYAIQRADGRVVRLFPVDQLPTPFQLQVKSLSSDGLIVLPSLRSCETFQELRAQPPNAPEMRSHDTSYGTQDSMHSAQNDIDSIINQAQPSQPYVRTQGVFSRIPPFSAEARPSKIYCDMWLFKGICGFTQQGCKFKHEMPMDRLTQEKVGLNAGLPDWYKRRQTVEFISQPSTRGASSVVNASSAGANSNTVNSGHQNIFTPNSQSTSFMLTPAERQKMNGTSTRQIGNMGLQPAIHKPDFPPNHVEADVTRNTASSTESSSRASYRFPDPFPAPSSPPIFSPGITTFDTNLQSRLQPGPSSTPRNIRNASIASHIHPNHQHNIPQQTHLPFHSINFRANEIPSHLSALSTSSSSSTNSTLVDPSSSHSDTRAYHYSIGQQRVTLPGGGVSLLSQNPYGNLNCLEDEGGDGDDEVDE